MSDALDTLAYRTVKTDAPTITIPTEDYNSLVASSVFLNQIIGDQGFMGYDEFYPELLVAAGFVELDEDEDEQEG
jgi:hypothetical protein